MSESPDPDVMKHFRFEIREAIEDIVDRRGVDREEVAEALKDEATTVLFGHPEAEPWLEGLGKPIDKQGDNQ